MRMRSALCLVLVVLSVLLASCGNRAAPPAGPSAPPSLSAAARPALPELEGAEDLEPLAPSDFGCFVQPYPTQYGSYPLLSGVEPENTVYTLTGAEEGPVIYIVGGTHGDELAGWYAGILLKKAALRRGTVYIVAPFNQYGAERGRRETGGGWDLNRHFPGDAQGNEADRLAAALYADIEDKRPDLVLDLHEARFHTDGRDNLGNSIICQDMTPIADLVLELMAASDSGALPLTAPLALFGSPPEGSLNRTVAQDLGIPVITVETDRREPLELRVSNQLRVAEYICMWYDMA